MEDLYSEYSVGETAFCALAAINVSNVSFEEYSHVAEVALRAVDKMIEKAPMFSKALKNSILKRRSVGIGITGLAGAFYKENLDYDGSEASFSFVNKLVQAHYYHLLKASQLLSSESGVAVEGVDFNWLPLDTSVNDMSLEFDWEALRGIPRKHSVLVAHMPTESSAVFSSAVNSLYPPRKKVINKKARKGVVQFICEDFIEGRHKTAWDVDNITLSKYYGIVQDWADQGISADYYFDPSKYSDEKKPLSELMREWVAQAKYGNKSMYYHNTNDFNGGSFQDVQKMEVVEDACQGGCTI